MKTYSIRQILFLIVFALIFPACLIAIGFSVKAYYVGRDGVTTSTLQTARAMTLVVERELGALQSAVQTLSYSPSLTAGDLAAFHAEASDVLRDTNGFNFVLSDRSGRQLVNTLKPFGSVLPQNNRDATLTRLFATGKPVISDVFLGEIVRKPVVSIATPVVRNGEVLYALDIGIWLDQFSKILVAQNIPQDWVVTITDSSGTIVARNKAADKFVGKKGGAERLRAMARNPEGIIEATSLEGIRVIWMYSRSASTGWAVSIGVPVASINLGLWRSLWLTTGATIILLILGILIARFASAVITRSIQSLVPQAQALGRGERLSMPPLAIREAADVSGELEKASYLLQASENKRHEAEDILRQSEAKYSAIFDTAPFAIALTKLPEGLTVSVNDAFVKLFEYSRDEIIGKSTKDLGISDAASRTSIEAELIQHGSLRSFECIRFTKSGAMRRLSINVDLVVIDGQSFHLNMIEDITDIRAIQEQRNLALLEVENSKRAMIEALLRASHASAEALLNAIPDAALIIGTAGFVEVANRRQVTDYSSGDKQLTEMHAHDLMPPELAGPRLRIVEEVKATKSAKIFTDSWAGRYFENSIYPISDDDGVASRVAIVSRDVTDIKRAEDQLRIVATAFESQEAMMITDAQTLILRVNRAFSESTGYLPADVVGLAPRVFKSDRHDAIFYATMWECIHRDGSWHGEIWDQRKNGEVFPNWLTITAVKNDDRVVTNYVATQVDITTRKKAEEEIKLLAFFDTLTNLPNRRLLMDRLRQALATSARSGRLGALMFIDLDNFKTLNDTLGHDKGDLLLQQIAERLPSCVRSGDTVARLGGDEFVVMLEELSESGEQSAIQAETIGTKILEMLNQPYNLAGHEYRSTSSIGVTMFSGRQHNIEDLLKRADLAMYQAKASGRNALRFFEPQMQAVVTAQAELEVEMRLGLQRQEFVLHYQAQVDRDGHVIGAEALIRWNHPLRGIVPPNDFILRAEETGLILPLGHWVMETACTQLAAWACEPVKAALTIAVNVSGRQFRRSDFVEVVQTVLARTGANPHRLKLEITESLLLDDMDDIIAKMTTLQERGVSFSLDDFGTGYSSLAYLKLLPLDQLKIDRSFVCDVLIDANDAAIARTILALGKSLGLAVIAEGVETEEQRIFLDENGCNAYQGFLFGHPVPINEFELILA